MKLLRIIAIALIIIIAIIFAKFRPAYAVTLNGEEIGYVSNKEDFETLVDETILTSDEDNVAFVELDDVEYSFSLVSRSQVNDSEVLEVLADNAQNIYRVYEVADLNNEETTVYVNTLEEAEAMVASLKEQYSEVELDLVINTIYLEDIEEVNDETIALAKAALEESIQEEVEVESRTVNGIYLAVTPVSGYISSRYGANESVRNHTHKGLDIAAAAGTPIYATAAGTVTFAGWSSGYGYLVIIDHGNGVETYYGHCSKLYVSAGETVEAGETIAAVGSTGNSTGNHLHFEIRINGVQVDPQLYLYN